MAEHSFQEVMKQFARMCKFYFRTHGNDCIEECPFMQIAVTNCETFATNCPSKFEELVMAWAAEHPEPVYPTFREWLISIGVIDQMSTHSVIADILTMTRIPADIVQKLGLKPKENKR